MIKDTNNNLYCKTNSEPNLDNFQSSVYAKKTNQKYKSSSKFFEKIKIFNDIKSQKIEDLKNINEVSKSSIFRGNTKGIQFDKTKDSNQELKKEIINTFNNKNIITYLNEYNEYINKNDNSRLENINNNSSIKIFGINNSNENKSSNCKIF